MDIITKIENAIARSFNFKFEGAIFVEATDINNSKCKVYDMNYTTFNKKLVGIYYNDADVFFKL